jgi:hypothetical protein
MRNFRDFVLAAVCVIAYAAIWEMALRMVGVRYDYSFYQADPVLYAKYRPNAEGWEVKESENFVRMNSFGMRDRERTLTPAQGTTRIAVLGDSLEAGMQVPLEKTMAQLLEHILNDKFTGSRHSIEVLNFAQGGATIAQECLMLRDRVWAFQPQIVILFVGSTSIPTATRQLSASDTPFYIFSGGRLIPDPKNQPPADSSSEAIRQHDAVSNLMNRYRLLLLVRKATQDGVDRERAKLSFMRRPTGQRQYNPMDTWFQPPATAEEQNAWYVAEGLLSLAIEDARHHGAEFWLASSGTEIEDNPNASQREAFFKEHNYGVTYAENRFGVFATTEGIPYIRLEPDLLQYAESNMTPVRGFFNTQPNRGHWNERGNSAVACIVADRLLKGSDVLRSLAEASSSVLSDSQKSTP